MGDGTLLPTQRRQKPKSKFTKLFDKSIYEPFLVLMCPDFNGYTKQVICLKTATISLSASASSYPHGVYAEQIIAVTSN